jgi:hypothetical protein
MDIKAQKEIEAAEEVIRNLEEHRNALLAAAKFAVSALSVHNSGGSTESASNLKRAQGALFHAVKASDPAYYGLQ